MRLLIVSMLCAFFSVANASDDSVKLIQPKASGLVLNQLRPRGDTAATFSGSTWLSGTFIAEWIGESKTADFLLVPDAKAMQKLPHFTIKDGSNLLRYRVRSIEVENGIEALRLSLGSAKAEALLKKELKVVNATGSFLIEHYSVGVECDNYWAKAKIVDTKIPDSKKVARVKTPESC